MIGRDLDGTPFWRTSSRLGNGLGHGRWVPRIAGASKIADGWRLWHRVALVPRVAALVVASGLLLACSRVDPPTVTPAKPLPADPEIALESMQVECDGLISALATYKTCGYLEDEDKDNLDDWIETANRNFAASRKANPEPNAQKTIAQACRKAADSVKAATERCKAGPRPKVFD